MAETRVNELIYVFLYQNLNIKVGMTLSQVKKFMYFYIRI